MARGPSQRYDSLDQRVDVIARGLRSAVPIFLFVLCIDACALELGDVRFVDYELGPARESSRFLVGERIMLIFRATGVGRTVEQSLDMLMDIAVRDASGKEVAESSVALSRSSPFPGAVPLRVVVSPGKDWAPGGYVVVVRVTDNVTRSTATIESPFELVEAELSITSVGFYADEKMTNPLAPPFYERQTLEIHCLLVGFARKGDEFDVKVSLTLRDGTARELFSSPTFLRKRDEIDEKIAAVPLSLKLALSSPGDYVLEVKATDMNAGRSASRVIPIKVRTATREN